MLENMHRIMERMDTLAKSFSGMSRRKVRREKQTFAAAMNEITKTDISANPTTTALTDDLKGIIKIDGELLNKLIDKHSNEKGLDPDLVKTLIRVASDNNPETVSKDGKLGLMQVSPDIFREFGYTDPFDPDQNISAGTSHLKSLINNNGGNLQRALAAYSSDPFSVKQYNGVPPFPQTQNFVSQILGEIGKDDKR